VVVVVLVTIPVNKAKKLVKIILENKACACVNIIKDIESYFWWQGKIQREKEALLVIKTKKSAFLKLKKIIKKNHPYEVAEIIAVNIAGINSEYRKWLIGEVDA